MLIEVADSKGTSKDLLVAEVLMKDKGKLLVVGKNL